MVSLGQDGIGIEAIEILKDIGYDYFELPLAQIMALSKNEFEKIKKKIFATGLKSEVLNNFFPKYLQLTGNNVDNKKIEKYTEQALDKASILGAEVIVFGSAKAKNVPSGFPMYKAWNQLVELLRLN